MYFDDAKDYYSTLFDDAYYDNIQCTMYVMYIVVSHETKFGIRGVTFQHLLKNLKCHASNNYPDKTKLSQYLGQ